MERMSEVCETIARNLGISGDDCDAIRAASRLHDIGKIGVPDQILLKEGPLTSLERLTMNTHTRIGHELLSGSDDPTLHLAAVIALTHHEWFDGTGHPYGLAGEDIPIEGRIAAVADVFDALTSDRPYREALPSAEALEMMMRGRGTQFDPLVFDAFMVSAAEVAVGPMITRA
jgi:putative two-component system response regulator